MRMIQRLKDMAHEWRIAWARLRVTRYPTRANNEHFRRLVMARSASQVARMEKRLLGR